jgi:membrane protease YdiL (CAAX protease family)
MYRGAGLTFCTACGKPRVSGATDVCAYCGAPVGPVESTGPSAQWVTQGVFWAIGLALALVFMQFAGLSRDEPQWQPLAFSVAILVPAVVLRARYADCLRRWGARRDWLVAAAGGVSLAAAQVAMSDALFFSPWDASPYDVVALSVAWIVGAVVLEELALRGIAFSLLRHAIGARETIIVTTVVFVILRVAWFDWMLAVPLGILVGWLRERSGSIAPGLLTRLTIAAVTIACT